MHCHLLGGVHDNFTHKLYGRFKTEITLHCCSYKTLCLGGNYVKVRSRHKLNVLCILWCNLSFKSSVWLIWWNCCEHRPADGSASKFRRFVVLYLTILHAAKYFQVHIYLVKVLMYGRIRFFYRIWQQASIKNIMRLQKCCMMVKSSNMWIFSIKIAL